MNPFPPRPCPADILAVLSSDGAIHQAGEQWPELRQAVEAIGSGVTIKKIAVVADGKGVGEVQG